MPGDRGVARVVLTGALAMAPVVAAVGVPIVTGAPDPTAADVLVTVGLGAAAGYLLLAGEAVPSVLVWLAAGVWTVTGLATSLPDAVALPVARLVLVPHAALVVALIAAVAVRRWVALPVLLAVAAALAGGLGVPLPVLAMLGVALMTAALVGPPGAPRSVRLATAALGLAAVSLDPRLLGGTASPALLATVVDLLLLGVTAVLVWQATQDPLRRAELALQPWGDDPVERWLARVLGVKRLAVAFPSDRGPVDWAGLQATYSADARPVGDERGVAALLSPATQVDRALHEPLVAILRHFGVVAWLRAESREQAQQIVVSRGRLQAAADDEAHRLERRLEQTVMTRLDRIDALLRESGSPLTKRVHEVRGELLRHARGLDPLAGRTLSEALMTYRSRGVAVEVGDIADVDGSWARTAWYVATEGLTNANKHAPGARVRLEVFREGPTLRLVVADRGPGGADPAGAGLQGLADRVAAVGGELSIISGPAGTTLTCALPRQNADAAARRQEPGSVVLEGR